MSSTSETPVMKLIGRVKWFNKKAGYGFITYKEGTTSDEIDVFVHYSGLKVTNSQYKFLVQGEYIEFVLEKSTSGPHEFKAVDITGIQGGELMCEVVRTTPPQLQRPNSSHGNRRIADDSVDM